MSGPSVSSAVRKVLDALAPRGKGLRSTPRGWQARCPAHDDRTPSLSIAQGNDGRALVHCHAGCRIEQIVAALSLTLSDLFAERTP
jgi:hypothetical protein